MANFPPPITWTGWLPKILWISFTLDNNELANVNSSIGILAFLLHFLC
jgi:hypothetical protein